MALIYEVRKQVLGFKEDKPTVYKVAAVRQQKVDFAKLVKEVSDSCGVHRTQSKAVVEALIDRLVHYMDFGMAVQLAEFRHVQARHPYQGEEDGRRGGCGQHCDTRHPLLSGQTHEGDAGRTLYPDA